MFMIYQLWKDEYGVEHTVRYGRMVKDFDRAVTKCDRLKNPAYVRKVYGGCLHMNKLAEKRLGIHIAEENAA